MNNSYQFENLSGLAPVPWSRDLHFVGTGMTPEAIGKLIVKAVEPLGHCASGLSIIHTDGSRTPMSAYYPKDGGIQR